MKRRLPPRPLLLLLLLAITTVLSYRAALRSASGSVDPSPTAAFPNGTLVGLAAADPGRADLRTEVEQLLEASLTSFDGFGGRFRSISLWQREPRKGERLRSLARLRLPVAPSWPPDSNQVLLEFRRLLAVWFRRRLLEPSAAPPAMSELLGLVKRPVDLHLGRPDTGRRYASCAVVGNSGILLGSGQGDLIDGHDLVIRLNNARTATYARDVGSKTSLSFVNSHILHLCTRRDGCACHPYGDSVPIIMYMCQPVHFLDYVICNASHKSPLLVTDSMFDTLCARIAKYYSLKRFVEETGKPPEEWVKSHDEKMFHYSSGMQAIMVAVGICNQVSIFGFGKSAGVKHHYHTNQKAELDLHDYEAEYAFYRDLMERPWTIPFLKDSGFKVPPIFFHG